MKTYTREEVQAWRDDIARAAADIAARYEANPYCIQDILALARNDSEAFSFQQRVLPWSLACFGHDITYDLNQCNHRFTEEALELVQSLGMSKGDALELVEYVYGRPLGEPRQEVGGVMVTLARLCLANALDMHVDAEVELIRIWRKVKEIRAKNAAKPKFGPLPGPTVEVAEV